MTEHVKLNMILQKNLVSDLRYTYLTQAGIEPITSVQGHSSPTCTSRLLKLQSTQNFLLRDSSKLQSQNVEKLEEERGLNPGPQVNNLRPYQCNAPTNLLVSGIYIFIHMYTVLIRRKKGGHGAKRIRTRVTWIRASHPTAAPCLCLRWSGKLNLFTYGLNSLYIQTFKIFFYFQDMNYNHASARL